MSAVKIAGNLLNISESSTLAFNEEVQRQKAKGRKIFHFGFGESRFPPTAKLKKALAKYSDKISYEPVAGIPELQKAVADFWNRQFNTGYTPDRVIIAPGSKILIFSALSAIAGDVLLPVPTWVSYKEQSKILGKKVWLIETGPAENFTLTAKLLEKGIGESRKKSLDPKILILNSPGNPTGKIIPNSELSKIVELCKKQNIFILSDEIYAPVSYGFQKPVSLGFLSPEMSLVTGGFSKFLSLGGWRLGFALLPPGRAGESLKKVMLTLGGQTWSTTSAPIQYAVAEFLSDKNYLHKYIKTTNLIHRIATVAIAEILSSFGINTTSPDGGFYTYADFEIFRGKLKNRGIKTSAELSGLLLSDYGIAALAGSAFGDLPVNLRLRFASSYYYSENLHDAAKLLRYALSESPKITEKYFLDINRHRLSGLAKKLSLFTKDFT